MQIKWTRGARRNLEQAVEYIAQEDPQAAERVAIAIYGAVARLKTYPLVGRFSNLARNLRTLVVRQTPYSVRYRIRGDMVEIIRIHHQSRQWPS